MLEENKLLEKIKSLYGDENATIDYQISRYKNLIKGFVQKFGESEFNIFSSPGRIELSGNHTDHNLGHVLTASINLDTIAIVSKTIKPKIIIYSEGFTNPFEVDLNSLVNNSEEKHNSNSLIRGICYKLKQMNYQIGGFRGLISSNVLKGSGLSSSASFEVLIATIINYFYNAEKIDQIIIAQVSQFAENEYFGKPCGLMDQMACAIGGINHIDFEFPDVPVYSNINFNVQSNGYSILIVDTGESHINLTDDYSSIKAEMKSIANHFGKNYLRQITKEQLLSNISSLRPKYGERAILRSLHFFNENERVVAQVKALKKNNFNKFLVLVNESGESSYKLLQNIYSPQNVKNQPLSLALALTEEFIRNKGEGAKRIHGGGFAGTILVFLKNEFVEEYVNLMNSEFYKGCVKNIRIRNIGSSLLI